MDDLVRDDELLYRRVVYDEKCWQKESGKLIVTRTAFRDPKEQPSVDRAELCEHNPACTQGDDKNGVVSLITHEVRSIDTVTTHSGRNSGEVRHAIDVLADRLTKEIHGVDNPAHAEIRADPAIANAKTFRRFRTSLAIIANRHGWKIYPVDYR